MHFDSKKSLVWSILVTLLIPLCLQCGDDKSTDNKTDKINLKQVGALSGLSARDVVIAGHYAYVADDAQVLVVVDISNRTAPSIVGALGRTGGENGVALSVAGQYAYVAVEADGMYIVDVSQPATPSRVGIFNGAYAKDVVVVGNYAYIADQDFGLRIVDITNPASPVLAGSCQSAEPFGVSLSGTYAYCADSDSGLCIIDIANPAAPVVAGKYRGLESARTVEALAGNVFLDDDEVGPVILNVADPANPLLISRYQGQCEHLKVFSDHIYVSYFGGLAAIDISDLVHPVLADTVSVSTAPQGIDVDESYVYLAAYEQLLIFSH